MVPKHEFVDLVEFFERWPQERQAILGLVQGDRLDKRERDLLAAMIFIVDRVGPDDLAV